MSPLDRLEYALGKVSAGAAIAIDARILVMVKFRDFYKYSVAFLGRVGAVGEF